MLFGVWEGSRFGILRFDPRLGDTLASCARRLQLRWCPQWLSLLLPSWWSWVVLDKLSGVIEHQRRITNSLEISWGIWRQDATLMRDKPRGERHPRDCTSIFFGSTFLLLLYLFPPLTLVIVHIVHVVYIRGWLHYTPYTFKKKSRVLYIFQFFIIVLC